MPSIIEIADDLVAKLNAPGVTWSKAFTAERLYVPVFEKKDLKDLKVSVVPAEEDEQAANRGGNQTDLVLHVGVQKRLLDADDRQMPETDELLLFVDELKNATLRQKLPSYPNIVCYRAERRPLYSPEHLDDRVFLSVLALHFKFVTQA